VGRSRCRIKCTITVIWIMGVLVMVVMNVRVFVSLGFGTVPMIN
jgi:hypothetical protein